MSIGPVGRYEVAAFQSTTPTQSLPAPWTDEQHAFIDQWSAVRILRGQPGSGKTTALWEAVRRSGASNILYLTWSTRLAEDARTWFGGEQDLGFRPTNARLRSWDFNTFLGELLGEDVIRLSGSLSRAQFTDAVGTLRLPHAALGYWRRNISALYDEIRASIVGAKHTEMDGERVSLDLDGWAESARMRGFPTADIRAVELVVERLRLDDAATASRFFPELVAVARCRSSLSGGKRPASLQDLDALFVDEVQDLTQLELALLVDTTTACAPIPRLTIAGDEGQTVRATAFDWGELAQVLHERLSTPTRADLRGNLRSPERLASVVERATTLYKRLERRSRPRGGGWSGVAHESEAQVFLAHSQSAEQAASVLDELSRDAEVAVISVGEQLPAWLPATLNESVLTPAEAKGLEYRSVVLVGLGEELEACTKGRMTGVHDSVAQRSAVDRLRVAVSRSTSLLACVELSPDEYRLAKLRDLLEPVEIEVERLASLIIDDERPLVEQVTSLLQQARQIVSERPRRAWDRLEIATHLLARHREQADQHLVNEVEDARLEFAWKLVLHTGQEARELFKRAKENALQIAYEREWQALFDAVDALNAPFDTLAPAAKVRWLLALAATPAKERPLWLGSPLMAHRKDLLNSIEVELPAIHPVLIERPRGTLWSVLQLLDDARDTVHDKLLLNAARAAREAGYPDREAELLERARQPRPMMLAKAYERAGLLIPAFSALHRAGHSIEAVALARRHGLVEDALKAVEQDDLRAELTAFLEMETRLKEWRRAKHLEEAEHTRLVEVLGVPPRRKNRAHQSLNSHIETQRTLAAMNERLERLIAQNREEAEALSAERASIEAERVSYKKQLRELRIELQDQKHRSSADSHRRAATEDSVRKKLEARLASGAAEIARLHREREANHIEINRLKEKTRQADLVSSHEEDALRERIKHLEMELTSVQARLQRQASICLQTQTGSNQRSPVVGDPTVPSVSTKKRQKKATKQTCTPASISCRTGQNKATVLQAAETALGFRPGWEAALTESQASAVTELLVAPASRRPKKPAKQVNTPWGISSTMGQKKAEVLNAAEQALGFRPDWKDELNATQVAAVMRAIDERTAKFTSRQQPLGVKDSGGTAMAMAISPETSESSKEKLKTKTKPSGMSIIIRQQRIEAYNQAVANGYEGNPGKFFKSWKE